MKCAVKLNDMIDGGSAGMNVEKLYMPEANSFLWVSVLIGIAKTMNCK